MTVQSPTDRASTVEKFDPAVVPEVLRERAQWVCWRYKTRDGKETKVPYCARTSKHAKSTDSETWATFEEAHSAWRSRPDHYAGVGFVFAPDDPFTGIDLDGCIDDGGIVVPIAREIIDSLNSYTEVSPSGHGVKVFIVGRKPEGARSKSKAIAGFKEIEIYDRDRFFTLTSSHVPGTPRTIESRQTQLDALCAKLWPAKPVSAPPPVPQHNGHVGFPGTDDELIEAARAAKNGDKFSRLWAGDTSGHGDDDSSADCALCCLLAFWAAKDAERIDRLFRRSGLYREKWDERRGERTYGTITIEAACEKCTETYTPPRTARISANGTSKGSDAGATPIESSDGLIPLGQRDPLTSQLVLSPKRTLPTADAYVRDFHAHPEGVTLRSYAGALYEWRGNRYVAVEDDAIRARLHPWLHNALRYVLIRNTGELQLVDFDSNPATVKAALDTIRSHTHLPITVTSPTWLDGREGRPPAVEILPCKSLNLHIPTRRIWPATPALFTTNALDFDFDPDPPAPELWIKFLEQIFGDDLESVELLQEWMGYSLTGDTSQQKMLLLVGPRRSGKGTIGRVLTRLVGASNVAGPTTSSLAGIFGLQPLIDKSLAIVSDARFTGEHVGTVVERLLCISGEDTLTIDRKFLGSVTMKLPTRFLFLTNELPRMNDASIALAGRFLLLRLTQSFYGREDPELTPKLLTELPGILLWAIEGWKRLHERGRFVQPQSAEDAIRQMEDLASPVGAFVRECCDVGVGYRAWVDDLYGAWKAWCEREGRDAVSTKQTFGRDLMTAAPGVRCRRGTGDVRFYDGIRIKDHPSS